MRDLDRIRETTPEDSQRRRLALLLMAALTTVALVFSLGVMVGSSGEAPEPQDPLARLDRAAGLQAQDSTDDDVLRIEREALTFPEALTGVDERPEVEAAMAAAAAEAAHPDPLIATHDLGANSADPGSQDVQAPAPAVLPAAIAAGNRELLREPVSLDPLLAESPAPNPSSQPAPAGSDGAYTLQVISYQDASEAMSFASELRARGHRAFVVSADVPGRGVHWRVRIGPFESRGEAERYRQDFERAERINTFIVEHRNS